MKIAYFDCFSGISGDMVLGAFIDLGFSQEVLKKELKKLPLKNYQIITRKVKKSGLSATSVKVVTTEKTVVRTWSNIKSILEESSLDEKVKKKSSEILDKLAQAESYLHKTPLEKIHFHELGAIDTVIDAVGASVCLEHLGIEKVYSSPLATGYGMVKTEHGALPVPTPATLEILKGVPIYSQNVMAELTTPTGAAIIKTFASYFGPPPPIEVEKIGYGAGEKDLEIPNVLRVMVGEVKREKPLKLEEEEEVVVLETNIDNLSPEFLGYLKGLLLEEGVRDVWTTPIYMKKSRPALSLSVVVSPQDAERVAEIIFKETNTLGIRATQKKRLVLKREKIKVKTRFGEVSVKIGYFRGKAVSVLPEYEECASIAREARLPIKVVYEEVKRKAEEELARKNKFSG